MLADALMTSSLLAQRPAARKSRKCKKRQMPCGKRAAPILFAGPSAGGEVTVSGAQGTITINTDQGFWAGHLVLQSSVGDLNDLLVVEVKHAGDDLIQGQVPATVFAKDNPNNPLIGRYISRKDALTIIVEEVNSVSNEVVANVVAMSPAEVSYYISQPGMAESAREGGSICRPSLLRTGDGHHLEVGQSLRSLIAIGPTTGEQSIAAGAEATFTLIDDEPGILDRFFMQSDQGDLGDLQIVKVKLDGQSVYNGEAAGEMFKADSQVNPFVGWPFDGASKIEVTVANIHASQANVVALGATVR